MTNMKDLLPKGILKKVMLPTNISTSLLYAIFCSALPANGMLTERQNVNAEVQSTPSVKSSPLSDKTNKLLTSPFSHCPSSRTNGATDTSRGANMTVVTFPNNENAGDTSGFLMHEGPHAQRGPEFFRQNGLECIRNMNVELEPELNVSAVLPDGPLDMSAVLQEDELNVSAIERENELGDSITNLNTSLPIDYSAHRSSGSVVSGRNSPESGLVSIGYGLLLRGPLLERDNLPVTCYSPLAEPLAEQANSVHFWSFKKPIKPAPLAYEITFLQIPSCGLKARYLAVSFNNSGVILDDSYSLEKSLLADMRSDQSKGNVDYIERCVLHIDAALHESILAYYIYVGNALNYFDLAHYAYAKLLMMRAYKSRCPSEYRDAIVGALIQAGCEGKELCDEMDMEAMTLLCGHVSQAYYHHMHENGHLICDAEHFKSLINHSKYPKIDVTYNAIELCWGKFLKEQLGANNAVARKVAEQTMEIEDYISLKNTIQAMSERTFEDCGLQRMLMNGLTQHAFLTILANLHVRAFDAPAFINELLSDNRPVKSHYFGPLNESAFRVDHPTYCNQLDHLLLMRADFEAFWRAADKPGFCIETYPGDDACLYLSAIKHLF